MLPVPVREDRRNRKAHHRVSGREAAGFSQRPAMALEKCVGVIAVHGNIGRPQRSRDGLRNHREYRVIDDCFPRQQTRRRPVRILTQQAHSVKCRGDYRDYSARHGAAERDLNSERHLSVENMALSSRR